MRTSCVPDDFGGQNGGSSPRSLRSLGSERLGARASSPRVTVLNRARIRTTIAGANAVAPTPPP